MRTWLSRLLDPVLRRRRDERLAAEVQAHLDLLTDEHIARGLSPEEARLAARRSFGGVDQIAQRYRDQRGLPLIETLFQDVRFALRVLTRERGFALTAVLVLGVGIGVNNLFFTMVYAHKFRGLPIEHPDRVLYISTVDDRVPDRPVSPAELDDLRRSQTQFTGLAAYANGVVAVGDVGRAPDRFDATYVSANAFPQLGLSPLLGRLPAVEDDRPGADPIVLLGADAWRSRYNADPDILGRSILVDGKTATVVGIIAEQSGFPSTAGVWLPLGQFPGLSPNRDARTLRVFGRLRDEALVTDARAEVDAIYGGFETSYPDTNRHVRARVVPINERLLGTLAGWEAFITAGIVVILVACANVGNLMIARAMHRGPELAIRTSLGASRPRIVRQLLVESVVLAGLGGALGCVFSIVGVFLVRSAIPENFLPYWFDYGMDARVFAALIATSLATAFVFGLIPAIQSSRTDVNRMLKDGGRGTASHAGARIWTTAFLTAELALAVIMLSQVALAALQQRSPLATDAAIDTTAVVTASITLPASKYPTTAQRAEYFSRLEQSLAGRADITAVSRTTLLPADGGGTQRLALEGRPRMESAEAPHVPVIDIAPSFFRTLEVAMVRGREFAASDGAAGSETAIVNERFVTAFLEGIDPIGVRIAVSPTNAPADALQWLTIVGVAPQMRQQGSSEAAVVYRPWALTAPATSILMVRHAIDPVGATSLLRAEAQRVDPDVPLYRMQTLQRATTDAQWNRRVSVYLAGTVVLLSVLLAIVGLYAVTAQRVTLKTQEIGLRMALGARSTQVVQLILRGLRVPLVLGLLLGSIGALAWDRAFSSGVANLYAAAPKTLATIAACITVVVLVSCFVPLRKATRLDPVTALRHE